MRQDPARAVGLLESAVHECEALGLAEVSRRARQTLAFALAQVGRLSDATATLKVLDGPGPDPWLAHDGGGVERITAGYVRFWRGELAAARDDFTAVSGALGAGYPHLAGLMLAFSVAALRDRAAVGAAEAAVSRMPEAATHGVPWTSYRMAALARLAECHGDGATALDRAAALDGADHVPMISAVASRHTHRRPHS